MIDRACSSSDSRSNSETAGPGSARLWGSRIAVLCAIWLMAGSASVLAEEAARPPEKPELVLKYDPVFPDSMVVATVNSMPVTAGEVLHPIRKSLDEKLREYNVPAEKRAEIRTMWVKQFLHGVIDRKLRVHSLLASLTAEERKRLDEYLDKEWEEYTVQLRKERGASTMQELADDMESEGTSLEKVKRHWREGSMAHQFVLWKRLKSDYADGPTTRELQDYYEQHRKKWECPTQVKWQQIVVRRNEEEDRTAARSRAHEIFEKLQAGADFSEIARAYSDGPTKAQGGVWDWMESDALACREIGEFLATGDVGCTSDVMSYQGEFHIVRILDRKDARCKSFEEVEEVIRDIVIQAGFERLTREIAQELVDKADIKTVFGDEWKFRHPMLEEPASKSAETNVDREPSLFDGAGPKTFVYRTGHSEVVVRVVVTEGADDSPVRPLRRDSDYPDSMIVATVNSVPITVQEVLEHYSVHLATPIPGLEDPDAVRETPEEDQGERRRSIRIGLQKVVERKLKVIGLKAHLNQQQLDDLEKELEPRWTEFASGLTAKRGVEPKQRDHDLALMKRDFLEMLMSDEFESQLESKLDEPTSGELHDYYEQNMENWAYPAGVKWQEISVLCGWDEAPAEAEARARGLLAQLQAGADFSELARKHSEGITKAKGGFRDWTLAGAFGCQADEDFLLSARIGATSKVIRGRDEFHIVRLLERREAGHRSFEAVEAKIRATLKYRAFNRLRRETMQKLLDDAEIVTVFGDDWKFVLSPLDPPPPE